VSVGTTQSSGSSKSLMIGSSSLCVMFTG
jgi:hypothetical protein